MVQQILFTAVQDQTDEEIEKYFLLLKGKAEWIMYGDGVEPT